MIERRRFLAMLSLTPFLWPSGGGESPASLSTPRNIERVRLVGLDRATPWRATVIDAKTGRDVSREYPISAAPRLLRSLDSGKPVRVALFKLNERERPYLDAQHHIARRSAWVQVIA